MGVRSFFRKERRNMKRNKIVFAVLMLMAFMLLPGLQSEAKLIEKDGYEYYETESGYLKNAWKTIRKRRCYFDENGHRAKGTTLTIKGVTYKFSKDGYMKAGLRVTTKGLRYQKKDGKYLKKKWKQVSGSWYYFNKKGYAVKKKWVGNKYLGADGKMKTGTWVGSKFVAANGEKVTKTTLSLTAKSAILIDSDTGKAIYKKKVNTRRSNASTTKIMTAILALEKGNMDDIVTFSSHAAGQEAVKLYANAGEQFRLGDLMYALMLPSYNDVAMAIAEHIGGTKENFAAMMNAKAKELGCSNTYFVTPNGLDEGNHGSTAADLAKMARHAMKNSAFAKIVKTKQYSFSSTSSGRKFTVYTTNQLLGSMSGMIGMKTGYTRKAGYCFVGALKRNGKTYISVVLGAPSSSSRWSDTKKLMKFGIKNYK